MTENKQFKIVNDCGDYHLMNGDEQLCYDLCSPAMGKANWNNVVDKLNEQEEEIQRLKWSNKILRVNKKDCEFGRREERKSWVKMDKMRIEHIRLLQKRLKENGLSIYVYGDVE